MMTLKNLVRGLLNRVGYDVYRIPEPPRGQAEAEIPDWKYYRPLFSPWLGYGEFPKYFGLAEKATLVSADRCWVLYALCRQALVVDGDVWECGVYKGGTAAMLAQIIADGAPAKRLHLFDTFGGMPETDATIDMHRKGDFADTSLDAVRRYVKHGDLTVFHQGFIPDTFRGLEGSRIAFAYVDVDIRQSIADCCEFIFPRLAVGGFLVFDDYGMPSCPGVRQAIDAYFSHKEVVPLVLKTGQAVVFRSR